MNRLIKISTRLFGVSLLAGILLCVFSSRILAYDEVVIVIDPGHGGVVTEDNSNGGCIYNNLMEKDVNLITATALYNELSTYKNVAVYMTRLDDRELSLDDRVSFAKSLNADALISIHYNASTDHMFYGSEIFTSMYDRERAVGYDLASCISKRWSSTGIPSRGIKTRKGNKGDYYGLIRLGKEALIPTIICEHGYLDNDNDYKKLDNASAWQSMGILDAEGIAEYYGLKKDVVRDEVVPTLNTPVKAAPVLPDETPPTSVNFVIDEYDEETGKVSYSISAFEDADNLMYYGVKKGNTDETTVFDNLILWDKEKSVQKGEFTVPAHYDGKLTARVYNNYDLYTDSEGIDFATLKKEADNQAEADDEADEELEGGENNESLEIIDTIILRPTQSSDPIEIPKELVSSEHEKSSIGNKSKLGMAAAISVVVLFVLIGSAIGLYRLLDGLSSKKNNKRDDIYDDRWNNF